MGVWGSVADPVKFLPDPVPHFNFEQTKVLNNFLPDLNI